MDTIEFKDVRFMTAVDKKKVLRQWVRFLKSGCDARHFMKSLYHHLIQHCSFIAHYLWGAPHNSSYGEFRLMLTLLPPSSFATSGIA